MGKRFGRNQKRRMREEYEARLEKVLRERDTAEAERADLNARLRAAVGLTATRREPALRMPPELMEQVGRALLEHMQRSVAMELGPRLAETLVPQFRQAIDRMELATHEDVMRYAYTFDLTLPQLRARMMMDRDQIEDALYFNRAMGGGVRR